MSGDIVRIQPQHFVHILDQNSNITGLDLGPQCRVLQTNEKLLGGPFPCVVVPPGHYCVIKNPCVKYEIGKPTELRHGETDVRLHEAPFPLYPGESLEGAQAFGKTSSDLDKAISLLPVVHANEALLIEARNDFMDGGIRRVTGDQWQVEGPCTYIPTGSAKIVRKKLSKTIGFNESLKLIAMRDFTDRSGIKRVTGEEWLIRREGAYLPDTFESVVGIESAAVLQFGTALHLSATTTVTDQFNKIRHAGERWMITFEETDIVHPMIGVEWDSVVNMTVLKNNQYCKVTNCVDKDGRPQMGRVEVRCGPNSFFLHPEETIDGIEDAYVLQEDEAVVLQAKESFTDKVGKGQKMRPPGERWLVAGPAVYIPPVEVSVLYKSKAIVLAQNEGVYIRNMKTGQVRAVMGPQTYLPNENENLWKKELLPLVEEMLQHGGGVGSEDIRKIAYFEQSIDPSTLKGRQKHRVVTYRCPHNTACQVLNHLTKTARVIFGPDLVVLGPYENFNILSLSAGKPKKADALKSLALMLGPDFITDILEVETLDHARLRVKLAFNNHFQVDKSDPESSKKIFSVADFIGFACRQIGSRIRGAVAQITFDEFHRHSSRAIQAAVFGLDENQKLGKELLFPANNMVVSGIDVQSIEPVDVKMRDSLMKSIQMAIEISTQAIEQTARNDAICLEQKAKGQLERAKLSNEMEQETERTKLLELKASTAAVESTGQAVAEAQAKKEAMIIECQSHIVQSTLQAEAQRIEHECELELKKNAQVLELQYIRDTNTAAVYKEREIAAIEINKFEDQIAALGVETIKAIATSGPDHQVALLSGLGLQSTLITDGKTPINLFNTIKGLLPASN